MDSHVSGLPALAAKETLDALQTLVGCHEHNDAFHSGNDAIISIYEPELLVKSELVQSVIRVTVRDNGLGIPDEIMEKIFLPFFTTKPTGEGTGLGLSLSHDIIVKGHEGTLSVKSEAGKWTEFMIQMPVK